MSSGCVRCFSAPAISWIETPDGSSSWQTFSQLWGTHSKARPPSSAVRTAPPPHGQPPHTNNPPHEQPPHTNNPLTRNPPTPPTHNSYPPTRRLGPPTRPPHAHTTTRRTPLLGPPLCSFSSRRGLLVGVRKIVRLFKGRAQSHVPCAVAKGLRAAHFPHTSSPPPLLHPPLSFTPTHTSLPPEM